MARLFLVRIEEFKGANQVGEQQFQVQKQHALSAEFALLETPDEIHHFIKSKFELEDRQVKLYMKTFKKYDFDARGTTPICVCVHAYNFLCLSRARSPVSQTHSWSCCKYASDLKLVQNKCRSARFLFLFNKIGEL